MQNIVKVLSIYFATAPFYVMMKLYRRNIIFIFDRENKNVRKFSNIHKNVVKIENILYNYSNSICKEVPL